MRKTFLVTTMVFLAMIGAVYAFTCTTSTDATTVDRSTCWSVNATPTWAAEDSYNATNGSVWVRSAGKTTQSAYVLIKTAEEAAEAWVNETVNLGGGTYNMSICFADLTANVDIDADDIQIIIGLQNSSGDTDSTLNNVNCTAATAKNIDFGKPTCTLSGVTANTAYDVDSTNTVTLTSTNGSDSAVLYVDTAGHVMTKGTIANAQTYTWTFNYPDGIYDLTGSTYASDGTNSTNCAAINGVTLSPSLGRSGGGGVLVGAVPTTGAPTQAIGDTLKKPVGKTKIPIWLVIGVAALIIFRKKLKLF